MKKFGLSAVLILLTAFSIAAYEFEGFLVGQAAGDQYGSAMCIVDFNGDGEPDLAISSPAADDNGLSSGKVYIYYGGAAADTIADVILVGAASSFFGQSLSSAGDFNNDSYEDLLVGAPFYDLPASNAGGAFLFYGGPSADSVAEHIFTGEASNNYFGISVTGIGDFNGDGINDIAIGAYRADWGAFSDAGKVYIYYGDNSPDFGVDMVLVGTANGERFGYSLAAGDFNADTYSDLAVGAYSFDDDTINQGQIYVFNGGVSVDSIFDLTITGQVAGEKFGWALTRGYVNSDNYIDLIMGTDGYEVDTFATGRVYIYHGGAGFDNILDDSYTLGRTAKDYLGNEVFSGVDLDGDGMDEIIGGMIGNDDGGHDAGGAVLLAGGATVSVDTTFLGQVTGEEAGKGVALWKGFISPENSFIAIGARAYDNFRGRVYFYSTAALDTSDCCVGLVGDINNDGIDLNILDLTYLVDRIFRGGPPAPCPAEADVNNDGISSNILDLTFTVDRIFRGGPPGGACP